MNHGYLFCGLWTQNLIGRSQGIHVYAMPLSLNQIKKCTTFNVGKKSEIFFDILEKLGTAWLNQRNSFLETLLIRVKDWYG